jgi:hypothetical protein
LELGNAAAYGWDWSSFAYGLARTTFSFSVGLLLESRLKERTASNLSFAPILLLAPCGITRRNARVSLPSLQPISRMVGFGFLISAAISSWVSEVVVNPRMRLKSSRIGRFTYGGRQRPSRGDRSSSEYDYEHRGRSVCGRSCYAHSDQGRLDQ